jgi:hypothetical protein
MAASPSSRSEDAEARLQRCIRDLAALHGLPSMCVGRSPDEAMAVVLDALPTALSCDLLYLTVPGNPARTHASLRGHELDPRQLAELRIVTAKDGDGVDALVVLGGERLWCLEAEVPLGAQRGRLLAGRSTPLDPDTDRVLVRSAANIVGTTLENAKVLEIARRKDDFLAILG